MFLGALSFDKSTIKWDLSNKKTDQMFEVETQKTRETRSYDSADAGE